MLNALSCTLPAGAVLRILGRGQVGFIQWASTAVAKAATQAAKLRGAGVVRHWLDYARPGRAPQGYAAMAG